MSPPKVGIAIGLSSSPTNPASIFVWIDNQTDREQSYYMCCGSTFRRAIDVYDSGGHRLLSKAEREARKICKSEKIIISSCTCSTDILIAPHTMKVVDSGSIQDAYELSPGRYFVVTARVNREDCDALAKSAAEAASAEPRNALEVVVSE